MTSDPNPANTPLLLIAWRRPHTLRQVIDAIRPVIDTEIDWPCQIERRYSDGNQGCRLGVSRAITWFFQQVAHLRWVCH